MRADQVEQRGPGHEDGRQPVTALLDAGVQHRRGVRAADLPDRGDLPPEPGPERRVAGPFRVQHLERHRPARGGEAQVHPAHPARAQPGVHPVRPEVAWVLVRERLHASLTAAGPRAAKARRRSVMVSFAGPRGADRGSVADGALGGVGVLVVELVVDPGRDVDDLGLVGDLGGRSRLGHPGSGRRPRRPRIRPGPGARAASPPARTAPHPGPGPGPWPPGPAGGRARRRCGRPHGAAARRSPAAPRAAPPPTRRPGAPARSRTRPASARPACPASGGGRAARWPGGRRLPPRARSPAPPGRRVPGAAAPCPCRSPRPGRCGMSRLLDSRSGVSRCSAGGAAATMRSSCSSASIRCCCGWPGRSHLGIRKPTQMATMAKYRIALLTGSPRPPATPPRDQLAGARRARACAQA